MESTTITRQYLEALPFSDLLALADRYGIDVPENLNRGFLIADILDVAHEAEHAADSSDMVVAAGTELTTGGKLPEMYNVTEVEIVLRNPAWAFIFWNISDADMRILRRSPGSSLCLRICSFKDAQGHNGDDSFEIQVAGTEREQYVLLPSGKQHIAVELLAVTKTGRQQLAVSRMVEIPVGSALLSQTQPGRVPAVSPIMELSGVKELLREQYLNHRQSFS